ncbi:hypothetical protein ACIBCU_04935 [Streptomyces sp. NPDC051064]|uniref:hypothetical protein n=1 Tax=Streptomyces sp. NPDC051064 TaxID=3365641 RepID=UPI0037B7AE84
MMQVRAKLRIGIAAVIGLVVVGVLGFQLAEADEFQSKGDQESFCEAATPLDLQNSHDMTITEKGHVLEELSKLAPEGIHGEFDSLHSWYDHRHAEDEEDAREASFAIGEFIEMSCDDINIGGVRASRD